MGGRAAVVVIAAVVASSCVGPTGDPDGSSPRTDRAGRSDAAVSVAPPTTVVADPVEIGRADALVDGLGSAVALPADVRGCVTNRAATDTGAMGSLEDGDPADPGTLGAVRDLAAACRHRVQGAPRFAQELQRSYEGSLGAEQVACVVEAYADLDLDELAAVSAAAIDPGSTHAAEPDVLHRLLASCDIDNDND